MNTTHRTLASIKREINQKRQVLQKIHAARMAVREYSTVPVSRRGAVAAPLRTMLTATPGKQTFHLLAQVDSWFDYPPGTDLIDCLHSNHGHTIVNLAVAGSTLNDEAYGPVPNEMFGLPIGPKQSSDPSRIAELVNNIINYRKLGKPQPQALLLSAGGNDIAGDEFFSFINNARSGLPAVNQEVLDGVVNGTFKNAYEYLITTAQAAAKDAGIPLPVFTHGYDYPWPDGRAVFSFLGWKVGPWFDGSFNHKNYPNTNAGELAVRWSVTKQFIDAVNAMLKGLAAVHSGVFHVDITGTLQSRKEWANELHPTNGGFAKLAKIIDDALQASV